MRLLATDSLVLHAFDYRETSRIVRLATRDAGVVSVIARGARRPKSRYGHGLDLFTSGVAQLSFHPSRDLHSLTAFDATRSRPELAHSLARFAGAATIAELCLRFGREDETGDVHDSAMAALDEIGASPPATTTAVTIAVAWRVVAALGFAPALAQCASCHAALDHGAAVTFHHRAGGALCASCARLVRGSRQLPATARRALASWLGGGAAGPLDGPATRAHQRLLREFLEEHLGDGRPLRAFLTWEAQHETPVAALQP